MESNSIKFVSVHYRGFLFSGRAEPCVSASGTSFCVLGVSGETTTPGGDPFSCPLSQGARIHYLKIVVFGLIGRFPIPTSTWDVLCCIKVDLVYRFSMKPNQRNASRPKSAIIIRLVQTGTQVA